MTYLINIADIADPDDAAGRSYRQVNAEKKHQIPVGSLVEVADIGIRLFVVYHARDCDQTPLYCLAADPTDTVKEREGSYNPKWQNGHSEESLTVIKPPRTGGLEGGRT